ncbi:MAG: family 16 glycosylhydrolase [Bacteroidota bacterium]
MKYHYVTLIFVFLSIGFSIAQPIVLIDNFEGSGTINTWIGDNCGINTALANPFPQSLNTSATVLEYHDTGGQFANIRFDAERNFELVNEHTFSFKIFIASSSLTGNEPNQVSLKLQNGDLPEPWSTQSEIIKPLVLDQWQTVTFNFKSDNYINLASFSLPPTQRLDFNRVLIQINGENNNSRVLAYIDDFNYDGVIPVDPQFDDLVWSDEFETDGPINPSNWFHQVKLPQGGSWFNNEIQHYTNRTANSFVEDGVLKIVAKKETFNDQGYTKQYTSARLNSKFAFQYGKVEIRAKLPSGVGTWPALWTLGKNINENGAYWQTQGFGAVTWPDCGEIDIMEHWGDNQNYIHSAIHTPSSFGNTVNVGGQVIPTVSTDFHTYTLKWTEEKLIFSVDDVPHYVYFPLDKNAATWPFDAEQYLIFNIAILPHIDPAFTESTMEIDYVRVYQNLPTSVEEITVPPSIHYFPNPVDDVLTIHLDETNEARIPAKIYGLDGRLVKDLEVQIDDQQVQLQNLADLPKGIYLVHLYTAAGPYSLKFVKR